MNPNPYIYYSPKFNQVYEARDCVNGVQANCTTGTNLNPDDILHWNHGTATASILVGNGSISADYRGVTDIYLFSFKVYTDQGLSREAAVRGFEAAVAANAGTIIAEMQDDWRVMTNPVLIAANNAFDMGHAVVAANGDASQIGPQVAVPALGRGVIGVGSRDAYTFAQGQDALGPGLDGRIKPDLQGPTGTTAASMTSSSALQGFGGTSGATPYVGGGAAQVLRWLSWVIHPGRVYATMIALGEDFTPDNTTGAGLLRMPTGTQYPSIDWFVDTGLLTVSNGQVVDVPVACNGACSDLNAAIWWSVDDCSTWNMSLELVNPSGVVVSTSNLAASVWEKAGVAGTIQQGTWKLRVRGVYAQSPVTVYYSAMFRR